MECFGNKECRKSYYEPSRLANSIDECCRSGTASTSVKLNKDRKNPEGFVGGCFPCQGQHSRSDAVRALVRLVLSLFSAAQTIPTQFTTYKLCSFYDVHLFHVVMSVHV